MSKLSLSRRLLGSSEEQPPLPNPQQSLNPEIHKGHPPPKTAPAVAGGGGQDQGSPLSGWSDASLSGRESPPQQGLEPKPNHGDIDETDPFYYDEEPPLLNELYDTYDDYDGGDGIVSENEEEHEEEEEEEEENSGVDDGDDEDIVDLSDSPRPSQSPQELDSSNHEDEMENEENIEIDMAMTEDQQQQHRACQVCGTELSSMHYLQQVQHVKQCLSKRHLQGPIKPETRPPVANTNTAATATAKRKFLEMDIQDWLLELGFDQFIDKFISEEIDMTLVHALNEEDLQLLGISNLLDQRKFLRAAKKVGEEVQSVKRAKRAAAAAEKMRTSKQKGMAILQQHQQKKKQQTLQEVGGISATTSGKPKDQNKGSNNNSSNSNVQLAEQALLSNLYPATNKNNNTSSRYAVFAPAVTMLPTTLGASAATVHNVGREDDFESAPLPTPPLPPTTALASARVPSSISLFTSAAHCKQVTETLEARIEKRRAERPAGSGGGSANEQLGRGGLTFSKVEESRALKAMKLQALKEELKTHENTVMELKRLISGLEEDLGQERQPPPPFAPR